MTRVFLSGSRSISRLDGVIIDRVNTMAEEGCDIVVGDANGADKALQKYLKEIKYPRVTVFHSGEICRNNVGEWRERSVKVSSKARGWDFYTRKDREMALEADSGFILWDGKSAGAVNNMIEILKDNSGKSIDVYIKEAGESEWKFHQLSDLSAVHDILREYGVFGRHEIVKKIPALAMPAML